MTYSGKSVAILAPSSLGGESGGAERFYGGLHTALREAGCSAKLLKVPADESNFQNILQAYGHCGDLDLRDFDAVISTKAPTFAVSHTNHILYLVHTMRVFYDMFDETFPWADDSMRKQRNVIQKMDTAAIGRITRRFSIGNEVSERLRLWNYLDAEVLHPPLATRGFRRGETGDYFFLPGRLHAWKRVDLVIRAIQYSKLPLRLEIAGTGVAEQELVALANGDPRIVFLGRISDEELIEHYASALAVPFVPVREDYGYVTLEAFASAKPVITCHDSGEPRQFVVDGKTGLVCDNTPESVCAAMERLFLDRTAARAMGIQGARSTEHITWPRVAGRLLESAFGTGRSLTKNRVRKNDPIKVAVLDMQPIEPAIGGGRLRLLGLYHGLGDKFDTRYVGTYDWPGEKHRQHYLSPTLIEIDVPLSDEHHAAARALTSKAGGKTVIDIAFPRQCQMSVEYLEKAREVIAWADAVVFSHPWVYPLVCGDLRVEQVVIYDAHNVEGVLRAQILDVDNVVERDLLKLVVETEYEAGRGSDLILACSQDDVRLFERLYGWTSERMLLVPNGAMVSSITPATESEKTEIRRNLQVDRDRSVVFFIGSAYPPNVEAASFIIQSLAPATPDVLYVIAGGVGEVLSVSAPNVRITGRLDDSARNEWLRASDVAINPMFAGSGTNIKMFDFMSAGLPIVSTPTGARGVAKVSGAGIVLANRNEFSAKLRKLLLQPERHRVLGLQNRLWAENEFAWERISLLVGNAIEALIDKARSAPRCGDPPKLAHFSTVGQACGIGEYTARLLEELGRQNVQNYLITCATPTSRPLLSSLPANTEIAWHYDDKEWCDSHIDLSVVERIKYWGAEYLLIQYHPAFLSGTALVTLVDSCVKARIHVAVEVHNVSLTDGNTLRRLQQLGCVLIAHNRREVSEADASGINFRFLPLLVPSNPGLIAKSLEGRDFVTSPPLIASTGFIRPHKGLSQLIEALPIVRHRFPGARLMLQCSLYPSSDSHLEHQQCLEMIRALGLEDAVEIDESFRPIEEVHTRLAAADLGILPYGPSNEGGSASASTMLASGVPLLVSTSQVFADVVSAAEILANTEPLGIAERIMELFDNAKLYDDLAKRCIAYGVAHSAANVSRKLLQILQFPKSEDLETQNERETM